MSTIWEMAAIVRAEEARAAQADKPQPRTPSVSIEAPADRAYWCKYFGTTPMNLCCAIESVGREPTALRRFLESRLRPPLRVSLMRR